ncbi:MAG TPA: hemerythrin domain-containing protein [Actinomycetales bacterium]|nr:hemerythrin domain-containing protein [Actinomycetales bacterium]
MPDVVELIKKQHREVDELLKQAESGDGDTAALLQKVSDLLLPHSEAEESFVYPKIRDLKSSENEMVKDGVAEHHDMEAKLKELLREDPEGPGYDGKLAAFIGELRHHVEEEENDLLPVLSQKASDSERESMGSRFMQETEGRLTSAGTTGGTATGSGGSGGDEPTKTELYEKAKEQDVPGRSSMSKEELKEAVDPD